MINFDIMGMKQLIYIFINIKYWFTRYISNRCNNYVNIFKININNVIFLLIFILNIYFWILIQMRF